MTTQDPEQLVWVRRVRGRWLSVSILDRELRDHGAEVRFGYTSSHATALIIDDNADHEAIAEVLGRLGWVIDEHYVPKMWPCGYCQGRGSTRRQQLVSREYNSRIDELFGAGEQVEYYQTRNIACPTCNGKGEVYG